MEHFPELCEYRIVELSATACWRTGAPMAFIETYEDLCFYGGDGETLEMRVFCEQDLIEHLERAGFADIHLMRENVPEFGILHKHPWSLPISARRLKERRRR